MYKQKSLFHFKFISLSTTTDFSVLCVPWHVNKWIRLSCVTRKMERDKQTGQEDPQLSLYRGISLP